LERQGKEENLLESEENTSDSASLTTVNAYSNTQHVMSNCLLYKSMDARRPHKHEVKNMV
jgi:hypothetical protein